MDKDPGFIDTPHPQEKIILRDKVRHLLDNDRTKQDQRDTNDDGSPAYRLILEGEVDPDGALYRMGYRTYIIEFHEGSTKKRVPKPPIYLVKAFREVGEDSSEFSIGEDGDVPDMRRHRQPQGIEVPDTPESLLPITKLEGLELRSILQGIESEQ